MKMFPRILSIVALTALTLTTTQCRRAKQVPSTALENGTQSPAAKAPENSPAAGKPNAADLPGFELIPGGEFTMGDALDGDKAALPHKVNISAFYMQKKEVSKAEWDEVRAWGVKNGYTDLPEGKGKAAEHPVQTVSWYDVVKWCNAKSVKEGLIPCYYTDAAQTAVYQTGKSDLANTMVKWSTNGYRLPTEAEWEKAARDGLSGNRFPWGDTITHSQANYNSIDIYNYDVSPTRAYHPLWSNNNDGNYPFTSPVGSFAANGYGLYDMAGNVWEWCWDWYGSYSSTSQVDPRGSATSLYGSNRVLRGGCWFHDADSTRCAYRSYIWPDHAYIFYGFRLARGQP
jgi:sulfatase modifying factor 1